MSEKIGRRRAIAVSVAGAAAIAAAGSGFNPEAAAAAETFAPLRLPLTPTITVISDVPVTGGHQATINLMVKGSNGNYHQHRMVITRVGGTMNISDTIHAWNNQLQQFQSEPQSHTYSSGSGQNGTTQVSGKQVVAGQESQTLTLNYKNVNNPYAGITDPQALVNAVFKNKRLA